MKKIDFGDPITSGDLVEDADGAPLPYELQRGGRIANAIWAELGTWEPEWTEAGHIDGMERMLRAIAPILWPLLPSNDSSAHAQLSAAMGDLLGKVLDS